MKILKTLTILTLILFTISSCKKDNDKDDTTQENQAKIIGKWQFTTETLNGVTSTDLYICDYMDTLEFTANTAMFELYSDPSGDDGSNCELDGSFSYDYTIDGNRISLDDDENEFVTIKELTASKLVLQDEEDGNNTWLTTYTKIN